MPRAICSRRRGRPPATPSLASWVVIPLELAPPVPDHDALAALALAPRLQVRARDVPGRRREACDARWRIPPEHLWRRKRGFYVPIRQWLRGEFLDGLAARLPEHPVIQRWFRPEGVARDAPAARGFD